MLAEKLQQYSYMTWMPGCFNFSFHNHVLSLQRVSRLCRSAEHHTVNVVGMEVPCSAASSASAKLLGFMEACHHRAG